MSRFILGDDLGNVKVLRYDPSASNEKAKLSTIHSVTLEERAGVQAISAVAGARGTLEVKFATANSKGSIALYNLSAADELETVCQWTETRLRDNHFVGLATTSDAVLSCTSNGALRRATFAAESSTPVEEAKGALPTRLRDWRLAPDSQTFSYGGEEVELSVWNTEQAFSPPAVEETAVPGKKRKRSEALLPGELWRAKNVTNDSLNLRQPVRITSLSFLPWSGSSVHIVTGTQTNNVRRYDIRTARRPVADYEKIGKVGGIRSVQAGLNEHEIFVADNGSNLYSIDLRNGHILYGYPGFSGAVTAMAHSPSAMATTSLDRYVRTHDVVGPPPRAGERLDRKGSVTAKIYANSTPTCIAWDGTAPSVGENEQEDLDDQQQDEVWNALEEVSESEGEQAPKQKRRQTKS